jgi:hypothetical protein
MKTMHRTSTAGLVIGSALVAACAIALTALTGAGAGGAYAFLFAGLFIFCVFLIWPERSRPLRSDRSRGGVRPR